MGDHKANKRKDHEIDGPSHVESNKSTTARVSGAYGGDDDGGGSAGASRALPIQDNPGHGQNATRSAPVADQSLGRTTGRQPGVELGGSDPAPRHGLQLQGNAQGSGNRPPTPKVCPDCHNSVFSNNTICVHCACESARKGRSSPANLEFVADCLTGQQHGGASGGPPATENSRPGLLGPRQENPAPRAGESPSKRRRGTHEKQPKTKTKTKTYVCPVCHVNTCSSNGVACQPCATAWAPQQHQRQQPPPPVDAVAQQQQERLRRFVELAADIWPVEERGGASGGRSAVQLGHPGHQRLPQEHPVPRADKPVGFHYNPIVFGPGPDPEDGWCPACRFYSARTVLQPRQHDCVCYTCLNVDRIVCPVCAAA